MIELTDTPDIKVITGICRSGKSSLLEAYVQYLQETEKDTNIVMINLQELEYDQLLEYHALHEYILTNNGFFLNISSTSCSKPSSFVIPSQDRSSTSSNCSAEEGLNGLHLYTLPMHVKGLEMYF